MRKSEQSFTEERSRENSRQYEKISEKNSLSELSKEPSREEDDIVDIELKKKRIVSEKHRRASRGYRLRLKNLEKKMKDSNIINITTNKSKAKDDAQPTGFKLKKNKSKDKGANGKAPLNTTKSEKCTLNVFNTKHMELILQKNLRLNKKTQDTATQTEASQLHELILSLERAKVNSARLRRPGS